MSGMEAHDLPCVHRGTVHSSGQHETVYHCGGGVPFGLCSVNPAGIKINGQPLAACQGCQRRETEWPTIEMPTPPVLEFPSAPIDPATAFDRVVVINLERRTDRRNRLESIFSKMLQLGQWPFVAPVFMKAIDGQVVQAPEGYQEGRNVWACLQSHRRAIEEAVNDGLNSVLVLEDDAIFADDFGTKAIQFLTDLPRDAEFAFLGGHHFNSAPIHVKPGIVKPQHMDRMHAYAAFGNGLIELYRYWHQWHPGHCDHAISKWIVGRKTYCAFPWLVGQCGGVSDVMRDNGIGPGIHKTEEWWHSPPATVIHEDASTVEVKGVKYSVDQKPISGQPVRRFSTKGVGTELSLILKSINIHAESCGGCMDMILKMNSWGPAGCRKPEHRQQILDRLRAKMAEIGWKEKVGIATRAVMTGLAAEIDWFDPAPSLLDKAISIVESREKRPLLSACMATRGRPEMAERTIKSFYDTTKGYDVEFVVASHPDSTPAHLEPMVKDQSSYPGLKVVLSAETDNAIKAWNVAAAHARGTWLALWDDDLVALPGWLDEALKVWKDYGSPDVALLGLYDDDVRYLENPPKLFTRTMGTRKFYIEHCGGVIAIPSYGAWWNDNEVFERALKAGCTYKCPLSKIDHYQANRGKGPMDDTAQLGKMRHAGDAEMFRRRQALGFPDDFQPAILG